jgi:hypothetical protein
LFFQQPLKILTQSRVKIKIHINNEYGNDDCQLRKEARKEFSEESRCIFPAQSNSEFPTIQEK